MDSKININELPYEIINYILSYCDRYQTTQVCKLWNKVQLPYNTECKYGEGCLSLGTHCLYEAIHNNHSECVAFAKTLPKQTYEYFEGLKKEENVYKFKTNNIFQQYILDKTSIFLQHISDETSTLTIEELDLDVVNSINNILSYPIRRTCDIVCGLYIEIDLPELCPSSTVKQYEVIRWSKYFISKLFENIQIKITYGQILGEFNRYKLKPYEDITELINSTKVNKIKIHVPLDFFNLSELCILRCPFTSIVLTIIQTTNIIDLIVKDNLLTGQSQKATLDDIQNLTNITVKPYMVGKLLNYDRKNIQFCMNMPILTYVKNPENYLLIGFNWTCIPKDENNIIQNPITGISIRYNDKQIEYIRCTNKKYYIEKQFDDIEYGFEYNKIFEYINRFGFLQLRNQAKQMFVEHIRIIQVYIQMYNMINGDDVHQLEFFKEFVKGKIDYNVFPDYPLIHQHIGYIKNSEYTFYIPLPSQGKKFEVIPIFNKNVNPEDFIFDYYFKCISPCAIISGILGKLYPNDPPFANYLIQNQPVE